MARGRMIDKRISMSKKLGAVHDKARTLYFMIYPHLDRDGRIAFDDLDDLRIEIMPYFKDWNTKKIGESLNELADIKLLVLYPDNEKIAMEFIRFEDFQDLRYDREAKSKVSDFPRTPESAGVYRITPENSPLRLRLSLRKIKEGRKEENKEDDNIQFVINYFNKITGQKRSCETQETRKFILGRLNEGRSIEDFQHVIDVKNAQWKNDEKMCKYIRPSTLFRPGHFEDYLNELYPNKPIRIGEGSGKSTKYPMEFLNAVYRLAQKQNIDKDKVADIAFSFTDKEAKKYAETYVPDLFLDVIKEKMKKKKK